MCREEFAIIAVTNRSLSKGNYLEQIKKICEWKPEALILREKDLSEEEYEALARGVLAVCKQYEVPCILHTYARVAEHLGCEYLHLPLPLLRTYVEKGGAGRCKYLGTSVHSAEEAKEAEKLGACYVTAGHIYATDCKKGLPPRGLSYLEEVCDAVNIPVYAIGGIKFDEAQWKELKQCKAVGGCIMSGMMQL